MKKTVLLFESRDLCYESNRYFTACLEDAFASFGYPVEVCDLSEHMERKLEDILKHQKRYLLAIDFNSLLPRLELEDGQPYLEALDVPFYDYLVDHPLYHHAALKRIPSKHSVICIDTCHQNYVRQYYPSIKHSIYLPLGAMQAKFERSFSRKRLELLFLGTYDPEEEFYQELSEYPHDKKQEVSALIELMQADSELTQEQALKLYLKSKNEEISPKEFAGRLNQDYLADLYLRNKNRKETVLAAADAKIPFTIIGHGWDQVKGLNQKQITIKNGIGFAASIQVMADAKILLNSTPLFHGGLHDRVYSAMINHTVCVTEGSRFAGQKFSDGKEAVFYHLDRLFLLPEKLAYLYENPKQAERIAECAFQKVMKNESWQKRIEQFQNYTCSIRENLV